MKPFNPKAICPKCGFKQVRSVYNPGDQRWMSSAVPEHIFRACNRCNFSWKEMPLNLK